MSALLRAHEGISILPTGARIRPRQWPLLGRTGPAGVDEATTKYRLAASHPDTARVALERPTLMEEWYREYSSALGGEDPDRRLRGPWHHIGVLEEELYNRFAEEIRASKAPAPQYENVPGLSAGNGEWPRPAEPPTGLGPYAVCGVTVPDDYEYLIGGDGLPVHPCEDKRLSEPPPDPALRAAAQDGLPPPSTGSARSSAPSTQGRTWTSVSPMPWPPTSAGTCAPSSSSS